MRGVESQGMLCSARELGLSDEHSGLMLLPSDAPDRHGCASGARARRSRSDDQAHAESRRLPERGRGRTRSGGGLPARHCGTPQFEPVSATISDRLPVTVEARRSVRTLLGTGHPQRERARGDAAVDAAATAAQRPASDLGAGRHLELRDARTRPSVARVRPRERSHGRCGCAGAAPASRCSCSTARPSRSTSTSASLPTIAASRRWRASWAGSATAVSLDTRDIYVEAAFWWPDAIRGRARRFNFSTDAAHRFERGVDYATTVDHVEYITRLILDICGGERRSGRRHSGRTCRAAAGGAAHRTLPARCSECRSTPSKSGRAFSRLRLQWKRSGDTVRRDATELSASISTPRKI